MLSRQFSKLTVIEMLNVSSISNHIKKEIGFPLCEKDRQITHNEELMCIGTKCSIVPLKECGNLKYAGFFHAHPQQAFASFSDIIYGYKAGIMCIGENDKQNTSTILCHERKDIEHNLEHNPIIHSEIWQKERETSKDIDEQVLKRIFDKKVILNKYFNTIVFQRKNDSKIMVSDYEYKT
jgi:hypothetical protein